MSGGIESARLKVVRAMNLRGVVAEAIENYVASQPYDVVSEVGGKGRLRITNPAARDRGDGGR